jgi:hypothetical protein
MLRVVWLTFCLVTSVHSWPQTPARLSAATGIGTYSLHHVDIFSVLSNQASLAQLKNTQVGVYGERKFLLGELNDFHADLGLVTSAGNFGLQLNYYGFNLYKQTGIGLSHARKLGAKLDIGVQFNYNNINLASYGSASAISVAGGAILHITEKLHTGFQISNPFDAGLGKLQQEKLPVIISFGAGYEVSDLFFISTEIIKEENKPIHINVGVHYKLVSQLYVRAGILTATSSVWVSAGFSWKRMRLDIVNSFHPQLGITPSLMMLFTFPKKNTDEKVVADDRL